MARIFKCTERKCQLTSYNLFKIEFKDLPIPWVFTVSRSCKINCKLNTTLVHMTIVDLCKKIYIYPVKKLLWQKRLFLCLLTLDQ